MANSKVTLRRVIAVVGLLAAVAYVIFTTSAPPSRQQSPAAEATAAKSSPSSVVSGATPEQLVLPKPDVEAEKVTSSFPSAPTSAPIATIPQAQIPNASRPLTIQGVPAATAPVPQPAAPPAPATEADVAALENDLEHVQMMVRDYRTAVGENPVGTNAEIMTAVLGNNIKQAKIGAPERQGMNDKGELVDRWGTPYFFHQVSKSKMEVRSAGPDRVMWTGDDREL
jgi:hypothetical protein